MKIDFEIDNKVREYMFATDKLCDDELEQSLLKEGGARDKLIVAQLPERRVLLDGHRRHAFCQKHKLKFDVHVISFDTMDEVFDYMDSLALARRNLNPNQQSLIRGRMQRRRGGLEGGAKSVKEIAAEHGVSPRTVYRDAIYADAVEKLVPEIRAEVVERMPQSKALQIAELPADQQVAIAKGKARLKQPPPKPEFERARDEAGRMTAKLQNALSDVHNAKADAIRLKSAKERAKAIGRILDAWGTGYDE